LLDGASRQDETLITARTIAGAARSFLRNHVWALALAGGLLGGVGLLTLTLAIALALLTTLLLALVAGAITLGGVPATPLPGSLAAGG
jgi:hypothetical protein